MNGFRRMLGMLALVVLRVRRGRRRRNLHGAGERSRRIELRNRFRSMVQAAIID